VLLINSSDVKFIDDYCEQNLGLRTEILMENAASGLVFAVLQNFPVINNLKVVIVCGNGNNGADGLCAARKLDSLNADVKCMIASESSKRNKNIIFQKEILERSGIIVSEEIDFNAIEKADIIIDCIFGTGFNKTMSDFYVAIIRAINKSKAFVISADIPSGIESDTGNVRQDAVFADITVTFGNAKPGNVVYPGRGYNGNLIIHSIGVPSIVQKKAIEKDGYIAEFLDNKSGDILENELLPQRKQDTNKGDYGKIAIIAGSDGMCGAAALCAESCLRCGAGLVYIITPNGLIDNFEVLLREAVKNGVGQKEDRNFTVNHVEEVYNSVINKDVIVIGPGLGNKSYEFVRLLLEKISKKFTGIIIIDADGLNAICGYTDLFSAFSGNVIITPHPGEMARLTNLSIEEVCNDRINITKQFAINNKIVVLLKGASTVTADPNGNYTVNGSGNAGMATAGAGDVLSGIIGAIAVSLNCYDSARLAAYVHGKRGDFVAKNCGERALIAGDLIKDGI